jgi:hypothetical protein
MSRSPLPVGLASVDRRVRLLAILDVCDEVGMTPVLGFSVHAFAYLTDALAPVWDLPAMDAQLIKRKYRPFFPALQSDLDWLVGVGLVVVEHFEYMEDPSGAGWRLNASYSLNELPAMRILETARDYPSEARKLRFVREVVMAACGLGEETVSFLGGVDAAYSSGSVDFGDVLDLEREGTVNASAEAARRFRDLAGSGYGMSDAELVHLYVRHLYGKVA